jgi:hypothetical protein
MKSNDPQINENANEVAANISFDYDFSDLELQILREARLANKWYFDAMLRAMKIMPQRRAKYSGNDDPFTNFYILEFLLKFIIPQINYHITHLIYILLKTARLIVSGGKNFDDESSASTLEDVINYAALYLGRIEKENE